MVSVPGGGKGTLRKYLKSTRPELTYAVSCTSRAPRPDEVDGENYYFLSDQEFKERIDRGDFLEWIQQDGGRYYGTLKSEIIDRLNDGQVVLREVEIRGVRAIRSLVPSECLTVIFITAGSWEEMEQRMKARAPISDAELAYRKERYELELPFAREADHVIHNRNGALDQAKRELDLIIDEIVSKKK